MVLTNGCGTLHTDLFGRLDEPEPAARDRIPGGRSPSSQRTSGTKAVAIYRPGDLRAVVVHQHPPALEQLDHWLALRIGNRVDQIALAQETLHIGVHRAGRDFLVRVAQLQQPINERLPRTVQKLSRT